MGSFDVSKERAEYRLHLEQSLDGIVECLSRLPEVVRISVFGSYARGKADLFTDLDIIVVMNTDKSFLERQRKIYDLAPASVDIDILCYTPSEFEHMKSKPFLKRALQDEIVLYEKRST